MKESEHGCVTAEQGRVCYCCQVHFRIRANVMKSGGDAGCSLFLSPCTVNVQLSGNAMPRIRSEKTLKAFQECFQTRFSTPVILSILGSHSCQNNRKTLTDSPLKAPTKFIKTIGGTPSTSFGLSQSRIQYNEWEGGGGVIYCTVAWPDFRGFTVMILIFSISKRCYCFKIIQRNHGCLKYRTIC